ncbi:MAG: hypothetical protein WC405_04805 [Syntrophales bacterium]
MGKSHHLPEVRSEAINLVCEKNVSQAEVARKLGVPLQTVNYWVKSISDDMTKAQGPSEKKQNFWPIASITFGAVLAKLRYQSAASGKITSTDDFARRIGIGGSSLRMLEAGHHIPGTSLAYPLAKECNLSLPMTTIVISFVRLFDDNDNKDKACKIAELFSEQEPRLIFFAKMLIDVADKAEYVQKKFLKQDEFLVKVIDLMKSQIPYDIDPRSVIDPVFNELSPVLFDLIKTLSSRLQTFYPALDPRSLNVWESQNQKRIRRVWAYYKNMKYLSQTVEQFSWDFITPGKPTRPQYVVISASTTSDIARSVRQALQKKLPNLTEDLIKIYEQPLSKELCHDFERALWFNVKTGYTSLFDENLSYKIRMKAFKDEIVPMTTLNLYEIEEEQRKGGTFYCAFIDNSKISETKKTEIQYYSDIFYARALKRLDTEKIVDLFRLAGEEAGLRL